MCVAWSMIADVVHPRSISFNSLNCVMIAHTCLVLGIIYQVWAKNRGAGLTFLMGYLIFFLTTIILYLS